MSDLNVSNVEGTCLYKIIVIGSLQDYFPTHAAKYSLGTRLHETLYWLVHSGLPDMKISTCQELQVYDSSVIIDLTHKASDHYLKSILPTVHFYMQTLFSSQSDMSSITTKCTFLGCYISWKRKLLLILFSLARTEHAPSRKVSKQMFGVGGSP